jgi:N6-L-threonylcarbamoyladenine synthase
MLILGIETSCDETAAAVVEDGRAILSNVVSSQVLAWAARLPVIPVDHLEAHIYAANLSHEVEYPFVTLLASGGHTAVYFSESPIAHRLLGRTTDDAAGEAFDKVSAILSLGYPGGPAIERAARAGNPRAIDFPRTMLAGGSLDFSFSGVKTAVLYYVKGQNASGPREIDDALKADIAASFQAAVVDVLSAKLVAAAEARRVTRLAVSGGVAANKALRERLAAEAAARGYTLYVPPVVLCTDNAATVAGLAFHRLGRGAGADLTFDAYARSAAI